jgi:hypothetical protein
MSEEGNAIKTRLLGMPHGTAANRLRKLVLFDLLKRFDLNRCYRCSGVIETVDDLSMEHTVAWQSAEDPRVAFFNVSAIAFSHRGCNSGAAVNPRKLAKPGELWCSVCQKSLPLSEFRPSATKYGGRCRRHHVGIGRPERRRRGLSY